MTKIAYSYIKQVLTRMYIEDSDAGAAHEALDFCREFGLLDESKIDFDDEKKPENGKN